MINRKDHTVEQIAARRYHSSPRCGPQLPQRPARQTVGVQVPLQPGSHSGCRQHGQIKFHQALDAVQARRRAAEYQKRSRDDPLFGFLRARQMKDRAKTQQDPDHVRQIVATEGTVPQIPGPERADQRARAPRTAAAEPHSAPGIQVDSHQKQHTQPLPQHARRIPVMREQQQPHTVERLQTEHPQLR